jgi:hypothetical protein
MRSNELTFFAYVVAVFWWAVMVEEASEWTVRNQRNNAVCLVASKLETADP